MTGLVEGLAANGTVGTEAFASALEQLTECIALAELRAVKIERRTAKRRLPMADSRLRATPCTKS